VDQRLTERRLARINESKTYNQDLPRHM
jgi:hypothetical protein